MFNENSLELFVDSAVVWEYHRLEVCSGRQGCLIFQRSGYLTFGCCCNDRPSSESFDELSDYVVGVQE